MNTKPFVLPPRCHRRTVQKSASGCVTCRTRKLKCDETKPICVRCREDGRACQGYPRKGVRWSRKHEVPAKSRSRRNEAPVEPHNTFSGTVWRVASGPSQLDLNRNLAPEQDLEVGSHQWIVHTVSENPVEGQDSNGMQRSPGKNMLIRRFYSPSKPPHIGLVVVPQATDAPLLHQLTDDTDELVKFYFTNVCRIFSTFDSPQNPFRAFIKPRWQDSSSIFYTILSMSAAKTSWKNPRYKTRALQYQSQALGHIRRAVFRATDWNAELLFVVLMLGLSTAWHDVADLGLAHLDAMQRAILNCSIDDLDDDSPLLDSFRQALVYWEMVSCLVCGKVVIHDYSSLEQRPHAPQASTRKPHPWTGATSIPQTLFTSTVRLIQRVRALHYGDSNYDSEVAEVWREAISIKKRLEAIELLDMNVINDTGDPTTPARHHLLLAQAYKFTSLYQLHHMLPLLDGFDSILSTEAFNCHTARLGHETIRQLEQIPRSSGTCCVQPLLLLVVSTSLSMDCFGDHTNIPQEVVCMRHSVLDRLEHCSVSLLSEPVERVRHVVVQAFNKHDLGDRVFWMDMLDSMQVRTIIG